MTEKNSNSNTNDPSGVALIPQAIDLLAPTDRFQATSKLYVRLHRQQLLLRKYWWVVILVMLLVLVPAYLLTRAIPDAYQSNGRMWVRGKLDVVEGRLYTEELVNFLGTQADLLRSTTIQNRALATVKDQFPNVRLQPVPGILDVAHRLPVLSAWTNRGPAAPFQ